jgi:hypothetical protein
MILLELYSTQNLIRSLIPLKMDLETYISYSCTDAAIPITAQF